MENVLDPSKLTDSVLEKTLEYANLTGMLARDDKNPTTIFVKHLLANAESSDTLRTAAMATLTAMKMAADGGNTATAFHRMQVALATFAYFGYQLAQAQMAELPAQHS